MWHGEPGSYKPTLDIKTEMKWYTDTVSETKATWHSLQKITERVALKD